MPIHGEEKIYESVVRLHVLANSDSDEDQALKLKVKEINPSTMESKIIDGLYFTGEIIDVDAYTGGFNLQIAYSTAFVAAK